jgi:DNA-binding MarR family transcriptional regulator
VADPRFDDLIHAPHRLRICAMLSQAEAIEFGEVLNRSELSKSALSKHLSQLEEAGYITDTAIVREGRSRQLLSLTQAGRIAYADHLAALRRIIEEST